MPSMLSVFASQDFNQVKINNLDFIAIVLLPIQSRLKTAKPFVVLQTRDYRLQAYAPATQTTSKVPRLTLCACLTAVVLKAMRKS